MYFTVIINNFFHYSAFLAILLIVYAIFGENGRKFVTLNGLTFFTHYVEQFRIRKYSLHECFTLNIVQSKVQENILENQEPNL